MRYDVFMIAHGEPNAAENWVRLISMVPEARRIENVRGVGAAYAACAELARTPFYFMVDADNWVLDDFRFDVPFEPDSDEIVLWYAENPVNGLRYAHGAIKLAPTAMMKALRATGYVDFATSAARNRYTKICASEHRFNGDPFSAWAGAFRECTKIAIGTKIGDAAARELARHRLSVWCSKGAGARFGDWCLRGAKEGRRFGLEHAGDLAAVAKINDFDWLRARFRDKHVRKIVIPARA